MNRVQKFADWLRFVFDCDKPWPWHVAHKLWCLLLAVVALIVKHHHPALPELLLIFIMGTLAAYPGCWLASWVCPLDEEAEDEDPLANAPKWGPSEMPPGPRLYRSYTLHDVQYLLTLHDVQYLLTLHDVQYLLTLHALEESGNPVLRGHRYPCSCMVTQGDDRKLSFRMEIVLPNTESEAGE